MSVGKTADDGMVSIFTHDGVTVFKEDDVLITCKDKPSSLACATRTAGTVSPLPNHPQVPGNGNLTAPLRKPRVHPQTAFMISHLSGCMQCVDSPSNLHRLASSHRQEHPKVLPRNYINMATLGRRVDSRTRVFASGASNTGNLPVILNRIMMARCPPNSCPRAFTRLLPVVCPPVRGKVWNPPPSPPRASELLPPPPPPPVFFTFRKL
eukprot:scaffold1_cov149-Alexandrium_tamarense.AAC.2